MARTRTTGSAAPGAGPNLGGLTKYRSAAGFDRAASVENTLPMRVRVSDARLLHELIRYLRDCGCIAEQASATEAEVFVANAASETAARMEVGAYVHAWRMRDPDASAWIVQGAGTAPP